MSLCAVFVDAGYLCAASQVTCLNVTRPSRKTLRLDQPGVVSMLQDKAAECSGERHLRTYWYDGATNGIPTAEHLRIDLINDVKVRLGRINALGHQKGVDALIYRDLMTLARERAISHAYLVSGDGDLVEGVRVAQDLGVHVTLIYVQARAGDNTVSADLLREVDQRIELTRAELVPFVRAASVGTLPDVQEVALTEPASSPRAPAAQKPAESAEQAMQIQQQLIREVARKYTQEWIEAATDDDATSLIASHPQIPPQLDAELLGRAEAVVGPLTARQSLRHALRSAFWNELAAMLGVPADTPQAKGGSETDDPAGGNV
jgi:hypothetical protein